jgi:PAS domain S-box-containing protein
VLKSEHECEYERVADFKPAAGVRRTQEEPEQIEPGLVPEFPNRTQAEATLRVIVEGVEAEFGDRFFPSLVRHLAAALGVQYSFVSELNEDRTRLRSLAVWGRGAFVPNFDIPLRGTPCEAVLNGQISHHGRNLQLLFPNDAGFVDWGAQSYAGVPLLDCSGKVVGHLAIVDDKPMPASAEQACHIMKIFAARAWAEIERTRLQLAFREREQPYRDLFEEAPIAYVSVGTDGRIKKSNQRAAELFGYSVEGLTGRRVFELYADTSNGKPKAQKVFERFLAGQESVAEELECRAADGRRYGSVSR